MAIGPLRAFEMTGIGADEILGRNFLFLPGADTDRATIANIREALHQGGALSVVEVSRNPGNNQKLSRFWHCFLEQIVPVSSARRQR
jgi:hypothetical protein